MKTSPLKKISKNPKRTLMRKAIEVFNAWIRNRDMKRLKGKCYTCGAIGEHAGHYKHNSNMVRFNEMNVNLQCKKCNYWLSGASGIYALKLSKEYGEDKVWELEKLSHQPKQFTAKELQAIIQKYKI